MAGTSKANLMQTAVNASTAFVSALVSAGLIGSIEDARTEVDAERARIFAVLDEQPAEAPRSSSGGGGAPKSGGSGKGISVEDARDTVYNFGKFAGVKLGVILDMDGEKCAEYGYGEGEKSGKDYIKYLARNDQNGFIQKRAKVLLEG